MRFACFLRLILLDSATGFRDEIALLYGPTKHRLDQLHVLVPGGRRAPFRARRYSEETSSVSFRDGVERRVSKGLRWHRAA